jgi:hypothetical protein
LRHFPNKMASVENVVGGLASGKALAAASTSAIALFAGNRSHRRHQIPFIFLRNQPMTMTSRVAIALLLLAISYLLPVSAQATGPGLAPWDDEIGVPIFRPTIPCP